MTGEAAVSFTGETILAPDLSTDPKLKTGSFGTISSSVTFGLAAPAAINEKAGFGGGTEETDEGFVTSDAGLEAPLRSNDIFC